MTLYQRINNLPLGSLVEGYKVLANKDMKGQDKIDHQKDVAVFNHIFQPMISNNPPYIKLVTHILRASFGLSMDEYDSAFYPEKNKS